MSAKASQAPPAPPKSIRTVASASKQVPVPIITTTIHKVKQRILTPITTTLKATQAHTSPKRHAHTVHQRTLTTTHRNMSLFRPFLLDDPIFRPFFNLAALPPAGEEAPAASAAASQHPGEAAGSSGASVAGRSHKGSEHPSAVGTTHRAHEGAFFGLGPWGGNANYLAPRLDLHEEDARYKLTAELAGVHKDHIKVDVDERHRRLTISGEVRSEYDPHKVTSDKESAKSKSTISRPLISERLYGSFTRSLVLPDTVEFDKITANFKDGILSVLIPKKPSEVNKVRSLTIVSGSVAGDAPAA